MFLHLSTSARVELADGSSLDLAALDAALLAWLALEGPTPRPRLIGLLWPDKDAEAARNSLRQRVFQLRKALGTNLIVGTHTLALAAGVAHDLDNADQVLGLSVGGAFPAGEFAQWLDEQRARRLGRVRHSLIELADMAEAAKDYDDALTHAVELLTREPLSEDAHRRVMRLHYLAGDRAAALLAFDRCERVLKDEVGIAPSPQTLALLQTIEAAAPTPDAMVRTTLPASILRPPLMVGREREQRALQAAWDAGQVAVVIGEAGMGKSRLLRSFLESQRGVVMVAGRPGDTGVPFATLSRLLHAAAVSPGVSAPAVQARTDLASVLPEFQVRPGDASRETQRLVLERAVRSYLDARPGWLGFVVDDLHFADDASLEMLASLMAPGAPDGDEADPSTHERPAWRWALACRPAEVGSSAHALQDLLTEAARLQPVPLPALDAGALASLVDSLALPGVSGAALAPSLLQRTGGNPLFVLETLKQAWVDGALASLAHADSWPRPVSVSLLIQRRLAQLSPAALSLARVAAIAGVDFDLALAEHVLRAPAMQFADALVELEAAQVLRDQAFAHDLVYDAVRTGVPAGLARHVHAQVAQWLEGQASEPARVARHWIDAGQDVRALPWLERAAEAAKRALRFKEYVAFMTEKSAIEGRAGNAEAAFISLRLAAEEETAVQDDRDSGRAHCDALDQLATTPRLRAQAALHRSYFHEQRGEFDEALHHALAALDLALPLGDAELTSQARRTAGSHLAMLDRLDEAARQLEACAGWFDSHASEVDRAQYHNDLSILYTNLGRIDDALVHLHRAIEGAACIGEVGFLATAKANYACNRIDAGELAAADAALLESLQLRSSHDGLLAVAGTNFLLRALCLCQMGRYGDALTQAELAVDSMRRHQPGIVDFAMLRLATCWWHLGQGARVAQLLGAVQVGDDTPLSLRALHARLAWLYAREHGQPARRAQAQQDLAAALHAIKAEARPDLTLPLRIDLALHDEPAAGLAALREVAAEARRLGHLGTALAAHVRGAAIAAGVDADRARDDARAALALHERGRWSTTIQPAELWLHATRALAAAGDAAEARRVLDVGLAWLHATAQEQVPEPYRDSFLHRNPVHRELLAMQAQWGVGRLAG